MESAGVNSERPLILLDRDGTIIEDKHYLCRPEGVVLHAGVGEALRHLVDAGCALVMVSNQSGIGRGFFSLEDMQAVNDRLAALLAPFGVHLDAVYCCPHAPEIPCSCRKPLPGMVEQAVVEHGFSLMRSFVVGDKPCDVELGRCVGAQSVLVRTGHGKMADARTLARAHFVAADLPEATQWILERLKNPALFSGLGL